MESETEPSTAVYCRGVTKEYVSGPSSVLALRGVDLEVRLGELLMLVGPSGCGKTTLISVVAGILDHNQGQCLVFQQDLRAMGQNARTRFRGENVGFVFQAFNLLPTLTAQENVSVPLLLLGSSRSGGPSPGRRHPAAGGLDRAAAGPAGGAFRRTAAAGGYCPVSDS